MRIRFFGHAAVGLVGRGGLGVLLDPYEPGAFGGKIGYGPIPGAWDLVIVSHEHLDHNHVAASFGNPCVIKGPASHMGVDVRTYVVKHGDAGGTVDFESRISSFVLDDLRVVHPGDMGRGPSPELAANLSGTDLAFVPVGGHFTMGPEEAMEFVTRVNPKVVVPVHYKTPQVDLPIRPVDDFLAEVGSLPVRKFSCGEVELTAGGLPARTEIWVLPALAV